jgi:hypothetical protein
MPSEYIGEGRNAILMRIVGLLAYVFVLSWTTLVVASIAATLYAIGDGVKLLILNEKMEYGRSFSYGFIVWHYEVMLWIFGFQDFPGYDVTGGSM